MKKNLLYSIFGILTVGILMGYSGGAGNSGQFKTGAPTEGTCNDCHGGGAFGTVTPVVEVLNGTTNVTSYCPNTTYTVRITINETGTATPSGYGFQITALNSSNQRAGTFIPGTNQRVLVNAANSRQYCEHTQRLTSNIITMQWTSPANVGNVTFYAVGNCVNGAGTNGDLAGTSTKVLTATNAPTITPTITPETCDSPGMATVSGGATYLWSNGATTTTIVGTGFYTVTATSAGGACTSSMQIAIPSTVSAAPYGNNFDNQSTGWTTSGANSSWEWNTSTKPIATRLNKVWITRAATNGYNNNELSYLYSPCFSLNINATASLKFKRAFNLAAGDMAWLEYRADGSDWQTLGTNTSGLGWYSNANNNWTGFSGLTQTQIALPVATTIQFRLVFQTDASGSNQGFVLDAFNVLQSIPVAANSNLNNRNFVTETSNLLSIYPNPSAGTTYLQLEGTKSENGSLQVFNSTGSLVADLTKSLDKTTDFQIIPMENNAIPSGIYYIVWKNNEKIETRKYAIYK